MSRRPLSEALSDAGEKKWADIERRLPELLKNLWEAPGAARLEHDPSIPREPGLYLFLRKGQPLYIGQTRNLRSRLANHCRPTGGHNAATFAFLMAKNSYKEKHGVWVGTRNDLQADPDFVGLFMDAKQEVSKMEIRFILCEDPELRTVFEVYAAEHLGTKEFNSFETH